MSYNRKEELGRILEESASLKCAIIGIGNAGNQVLNEATKYDFEVFAINSSKQDLSDSIMNSSIRSYIIGNEARGAGKNRSVAKNLFKINGKTLIAETPQFINMCEDNDIIIVAAGTGGGTGSGVAPAILKILQAQYPSKILIFYGILPRATDSVTAQQNSIDCLIEISDLNIPYMLADLEYYKGVANNEAYESIGLHIVDSIRCINGAYLNKSSFGMIDENDMRTTISAPGYLSIYNVDRITQQQIDANSAQSLVVNRIKHSPAVDIMRDGNVQNMAVIINMPDNMTDSSKSGDYEEMIKYIGRPFTIFENYAITHESTGQMCIILSGQSAPIARTTVMLDITKQAKEIAEKRKQYKIDQSAYKALDSSTPKFLSATKDAEVIDSVLDEFFS